MTSACVARERPRIVSDFCLNDRILSFDVAPQTGQDDVANRYDSDQTVAMLIEHNAVHHRLCGKRQAHAIVANKE